MNRTAESRLTLGKPGVAGVRIGLARLLSGAVALLNLWYERQRQRRYLARLDDRLLRDIGIDRATAETEISKPFWRS